MSVATISIYRSLLSASTRRRWILDICSAERVDDDLSLARESSLASAGSAFRRLGELKLQFNSCIVSNVSFLVQRAEQ